MRLKLSCKETSRLLSQGQDTRLRLTERITLRLHLSVCDACTHFSEQLSFLRQAMRSWPGPEKAPPDEKNTR